MKGAIHKEEPEYPREAREKGIRGTVVVQITVGKDGAVKEAKVVRGPRELQQAALDAAIRWRFAPVSNAKSHGGIALAGTVVFNFRLKP